MTRTSRLAELSDVVLGPLRERPDSDWYRAPGGKWTAAQIVEHLALGMNLSAEKFGERHARGPMARRRRTLTQKLTSLFILGLEWYPQGFKAPEGTRPPGDVTRESAEAHFRAGIAKWQELERLLLPARRHDLFLKHPRLGDLTLEEWVRFHASHARHHAKQIRARVAG